MTFRLRKRPLWARILRAPLDAWRSYRVTPSVRIALGTAWLIIRG